MRWTFNLIYIDLVERRLKPCKYAGNIYLKRNFNLFFAITFKITFIKQKINNNNKNGNLENATETSVF